MIDVLGLLSFSGIMILLLLVVAAVGYCTTPKSLNLAGRYHVLGVEMKATEVEFMNSSATFTYADGSTETYSYTLNVDPQFNSPTRKLLTVCDLTFAVDYVADNHIRLQPLFGEITYRSIYLIKAKD